MSNNGDNLSLLIAAKLKETTTSDIRAQLVQIQEKLKDFQLTVNLKFGDVTLKQLENLKNKANEVGKAVEDSQKKQKSASEQTSKAIKSQIVDLKDLQTVYTKTIRGRNEKGEPNVTGYKNRFIHPDTERVFDVTFNNKRQQIAVTEINNLKKIQDAKEKALKLQDQLYNKELNSFKKHVDTSLAQKDQLYNKELNSFKKYASSTLVQQNKKQADDDRLYNKELESFRKYRETLNTEKQRQDAKAYNDELKAHKQGVSSLGIPTRSTVIGQINPISQNQSMIEDHIKKLSDNDKLKFNSFDQDAKKWKLQAQVIDEAAKKVTIYNYEVNKASGIVSEVNKKVIDLKDNSKKAFDFGAKFSNALQSMGVWMSAATVFFGTIRSVQAGFEQIKELDKAMTDLKKVTDETSETYKKFYFEANKIGGLLGKTTIEVVTATAEFARLGYSLNQAKTLAQEAILYSNVGGIDVTQSSGALISAIKGFGIQVDTEGQNIRKVTDIYNEIGNNFAITSDGVGQAISRSASSLKEAGNTIEQAVAMITAANAVIQDPEVVGTALKTVAMRLRGIDQETGKLGEDLPKLEGSFNEIGLTLRKDANTFKSTYEIMKDLASVWANLTDIKKADILEQVAGKRQGNVIAGLLNNFADAQDALDTALNSAGSVAKEQGKFMESLEFKTKNFQNALLGFWQAIINSDSVGTLMQVGTSLLGVLGKIVSTMGSLPAVTGALTFAVLAFNTGMRETIAIMGLYVKQAIMAVFSNGSLSLSVAGLGTVFKSLGASIRVAGTSVLTFIATTMAPMLILSGIVWALQKAWDALAESNRKESERLKHLQEQRTEIDSQISSVNKLSAEMDKLEKVSNPTIEQRNRLVDLQKQISDILPKTKKGFDDEGNAIYASTQEIKDQITELKRLRALKAGQEADILTPKLKGEGEKIDNAKVEISKNKQRLINAQAEQAVFEFIAKNYDKNKSIVANALTLQKETDKIFSDLGGKGNREDPFKVIRALNINGEDINFAISDALAEATAKIANVKNVVEGQRKIISDAQASFGDVFKGKALETTDFLPNDTEWEKFAVQLSQKYLEAVSSGITKANSTDLAKNFKDELDKILEVRKDGNLKLNLVDRDAFRGDIEAMKQAGVSTKTLDALLSLLNNTQAQTTGSTYDATIATTNLLNEFESVGKELDLLAGAYVKLRDGQFLSLSEINKLIDANPKLLQHLKFEHGQLTLTREGIMEVMKAREADLKLKAKQAEDTAIANKKILDSELETALKTMGLISDVARARKEGLNGLFAEFIAHDPFGLLMGSGIMHASEVFSKQFGPLIEQINKSEEAIKGLQASASAITGSNLTNSAITVAGQNGSKPVEPFVRNEFDHEAAQIELELSKVEAQMERINKTDAEYNDLLNKQIELLKKKRDLAHKEANDIRDVQLPGLQTKLTLESDPAERERIKKDIDELEKKIFSLGQTWISINSQMDSLKLGEPINKLDKATEKYEESVRKVNDQLAILDNKQIGLDNSSREYRDNLEEQNKLLREKIALSQTLLEPLKAEGDLIDQRLKSEKLTVSLRQALEDRLITIRDKISEVTGEMLSLNGAIRQNNQTIIDSEKEYRDKAESLAEKAIEMYRKIAEEKKKIELDVIEKLEKAEEERHKKAIDSIDDEVNAFERLINTKLKVIDQENNKEDFNRNLAKSVKERDDIQNKINLLSLDNSPDAKAKRKELEKQLLDANEKLEELKRNRSREVRKDGLQDQLDEFKKAKESEKKIEENNNKTTMDGYKRERAEIEANYQLAINNEELFSKFRKAALEGDMKFIKEQLGQYFGEFETLAETHMTVVGGKIKAQIDLANELQKLLKENEEFGKITPPPQNGGNSGSSGNSGSDGNAINYDGQQYDKTRGHTKYIQNKVRWWEIQNSTGELNNPEQTKLKAMNDFFRSKFGFDDYTKEWLKNNGYISFDTGGYSGNWPGDKGKIGVLHKKELILKENDTKNLLKAVSMIPNNIPTISSSPNLSSASAGSNGDVLIGAIHLTIEKLNGTEKDARLLFDTFVNEVNKNIKKKGQTL